MQVYLLEIGAALQASSTSSVAIGTGARSFTLAADTLHGGAAEVPGLALAGAAVVATYDGSNSMTGTVTSFDPATLALAVDIDSVTGAGTYAAWTIDIQATLRYASGAGYAHPSAAAFHWPRLVQPAWLRRTAFAAERVGGAVEVGTGEALLANADGALDALRRYGFAGQSFALKAGDDGAAPGAFVTELSGVVDQATHQWDLILLRLRDRLEDLRRPLQPARYAGSGDLEGTADTVKGKPKPVALGACFDVPAVLVDPTRLIYQVHEASAAVDRVYVAALELTAGSAYPDQATLLSTAPSAGQYRVYAAAGGTWFRLGTSPDGPVTADVTEGATAADRTVAQLLERLATRDNGIAGADVEADDVTALDAASSAVAGLYVEGEATILDAMNAVAAGAGAWFGFDRANVLRMAQLAAPAGAPAVTLKRLDRTATATATTVDLLSLERAANQARELSVPVWRVVVHYKRCWTRQTAGFNTGISEARKGFVAQDWRTATAEDAAVQTPHPNARELQVFTPLAVEADAAAEAARLLALHKSDRDLLVARVKWDAATAALVDLGTTVSLQVDRYGYGAGKLFTVVGIERDAAKETAVLELWG